MLHSSPYPGNIQQPQRQPHPRPQSAAAVSRHLHHQHHHRKRGGYTLQHAGRQVRIGPVAFWIVVGTLVAMAVWSVLTGTYFAFHEDVLTGLMSRQAKMQFAYEDRIAELRGQIDRITSRQLLDQDQFENKLKTLLHRQQTLEQRTDELTGDTLTTGSNPPSRRAQPAAAPRMPKPSPISDTVIYVAPPDREARLQSREPPAAPIRLTMRTDAGGFGGILAHVSTSLDKVAQRQTAALSTIEEHVDNKARTMHRVLSDLGVNVGKMPRVAAGGPFLPLRPPKPGSSAFNRQLYRVNVARAQIARYDQVLTDVPVRKPVGDMDVTSPFGVRPDPFLGTPAMHTGIDLGGHVGEPVHATAAGTISIAGRDGGYGNLVEINHGNGLSTRYGHLSEIDVKVGQKVRTGQVIGKIGSTGRSTGPHLHYETRVNRQAVNPQKFLRAGWRLGNG